LRRKSFQGFTPSHFHIVFPHKESRRYIIRKKKEDAEQAAQVVDTGQAQPMDTEYAAQVVDTGQTQPMDTEHAAQVVDTGQAQAVDTEQAAQAMLNAKQSRQPWWEISKAPWTPRSLYPSNLSRRCKSPSKQLGDTLLTRDAPSNCVCIGTQTKCRSDKCKESE
jgi:hypothetical protein